MCAWILFTFVWKTLIYQWISASMLTGYDTQNVRNRVDTYEHCCRAGTLMP